MKKILIGIFLLLTLIIIIVFLDNQSQNNNTSFHNSNPNLGLKNKTESEHFIIYSNLNQDDSIFYQNFCEGFYFYINDNFFVIPKKERLKIYLFKNEQEYKKYNKSISSYGYYDQYENRIIVNVNTGIGTLTHEIMHYFTYSSLILSKTEQNQWASEGISTFFEKIVGYVDNEGNLIISSGYYHPRRFRIAKTKIKNANLLNLINDNKNRTNHDVTRSFMLFMHKQNLFQIYTKLRLNTSMTEEEIIEKVFNKPIQEVNLEWKKWIIDKQIDKNIDLVNISFIGKNKEDFDKWLKIKGNNLMWNEERKIYEY